MVFQLTSWVVSCAPLTKVLTWMFGLIETSHALVMCLLFVSHIFLVCVISDVLGITCRGMLLFSQQMQLFVSQLDYCNLCSTASHADINRLQCIQNTIACIVCNTSKYSHITAVLKSLHWLPVKYHSMFKTGSIIYKHLHTGLSKYLSPYISLYTGSVNMRQSNPANPFLNRHEYDNKLHTSKTHFDNSFVWDGPNLWSSHPHNVRKAPSLLFFQMYFKCIPIPKGSPLNLLNLTCDFSGNDPFL